MLKKRGVVPNPVGTFETRLNVAFRQLGLFTFFEIRNPLIYFFFRQMQTRGVKILPGSKGIQSEPRSTYCSMASRITQCAVLRRAKASCCTRSFIPESSFRLVVEAVAI